MLTRSKVNGRNVITPKPETEEYNVRNFVYTRHRPFHPDRLWKLLRDKFILQLEHFEDADEDEDEVGDEDEEMEGTKDAIVVDSDAGVSDNESAEAGSSRKASVSTAATAACSSNDEMEVDDEYEPPENDIILKNRRAHPVLKDLLRSKGGFWLATRPNRRGEWSQAGAMLTMTGDMPFFCTMEPEEYEGEDGEVNELVKHDIDKGGEWGDRRQELVFIGLSLDREKLASILDECLLDEAEWFKWQEVMRDHSLDVETKIDRLNELFDDGFPDWPDEDDHDHDHDDDHEGHNHSGPRSISAYKHELEEVS